MEVIRTLERWRTAFIEDLLWSLLVRSGGVTIAVTVGGCRAVGTTLNQDLVGQLYLDDKAAVI